jgi:tetratricopeptide (TPR) repeat protein
VLAYLRSGLLDLPRVPSGASAEASGLAGLGELTSRARALGELEAAGATDAAKAEGSANDVPLARARAGLDEIKHGQLDSGLASLQQALRDRPDDLVLGNAYRMAVFRLQRAVLNDASNRQTLVPRMPPALEGQPISFLGTLAQEHPSRETKLQLALAWVDEMLLYPALEIKAPASVESVKLLSQILEKDPYYVPALFGRGLNYLHRPARLVWPESKKSAPDAASRDLGLCVAIGRQIGGGSPQLVGTLALTLGDAYAKEGRGERARSWWQIAENASHDAELHAAVRRRFGWRDEELLDRLEEELQTRMLDLDHPMTDLALIWR